MRLLSPHWSSIEEGFLVLFLGFGFSIALLKKSSLLTSLSSPALHPLNLHCFKTGMWKRKLKAVKFLWKRKHFEERSWKRKQTRKRLTIYGAGSGSKNFYCFHIPGFKLHSSRAINPIVTCASSDYVKTLKVFYKTGLHLDASFHDERTLVMGP